MESLDHIKQTQSDHDLLVRVDEKLINFITTFNMEMKDLRSKLSRVDVLERDKADVAELDKIRKEVDQNSRWISRMIGAIIIISAVVIPMGVYIFKMQTAQIDRDTLKTATAEAVKSVLADYEVNIK